MLDIEKEILTYLKTNNIICFKSKDNYILNYFIDFIKSNFKDYEVYKFTKDIQLDYIKSLIYDTFLFNKKKLLFFDNILKKDIKKIYKLILKKEKDFNYIFVFLNIQLDKSFIFNLDKINKINFLYNLYNKKISLDIISLVFSLSNNDLYFAVSELNKILLLNSKKAISKNLTNLSLFTFIDKLLNKDKDIFIYLNSLKEVFHSNLIWSFLVSNFNLLFYTKLFERKNLSNLDISKILKQKTGRIYILKKQSKFFSYKFLYDLIIYISYLDTCLKKGSISIDLVLYKFLYFYIWRHYGR